MRFKLSKEWALFGGKRGYSGVIVTSLGVSRTVIGQFGGYAFVSPLDQILPRIEKATGLELGF